MSLCDILDLQAKLCKRLNSRRPYVQMQVLRTTFGLQTPCLLAPRSGCTAELCKARSRSACTAKPCKGFAAKAKLLCAGLQIEDLQCTALLCKATGCKPKVWNPYRFVTSAYKTAAYKPVALHSKAVHCKSSICKPGRVHCVNQGLAHKTVGFVRLRRAGLTKAKLLLQIVDLQARGL